MKDKYKRITKYRIVKGDVEHFHTIYEIINDASQAYKGIIPADRWKEPYMSKVELRNQIEQGVEFWYFQEGDKILGVMGIQFKFDVTLIRHAYVRTMYRQKGIGTKLLRYLVDMCKSPILIGTWAEAFWAINFYKKQGFYQVSENEKNTLLKRYWSIPDRQIETSIVLASGDWNSNATTH